MKKIIYAQIFLLIVAALFVTSGCSDQKTDEKVETESSQVYTCPMHPEVLSHEPGLCPECNMNLVPKEEAEHDHSEMESNSKMENSSDKESSSEVESKKQQYTCGMHPNVIQEEPNISLVSGFSSTMSLPPILILFSII